MPAPRARAVTTLLALLVTGTLTACSTGFPSSTAGRVGTTTPTAAALPVPTATARLEGRRVTAPRAGISFDVPAGWAAVDTAAAATSSARNLPDSFEYLAQQSGMTVDDYVSFMSRSMEVVVMDRKARGYVSSVAVIPTPFTTLPSPEEARGSLGGTGATVTRVDSTTTPIGPALVLQMRMTVGASVAHQHLAVVEHGGRVVILTASAPSFDDADALARPLLASLTEA